MNITKTPATVRELAELAEEMGLKPSELLAMLPDLQADAKATEG